MRNNYGVAGDFTADFRCFHNLRERESTKHGNLAKLSPAWAQSPKGYAAARQFNKSAGIQPDRKRAQRDAQ